MVMLLAVLRRDDDCALAGLACVYEVKPFITIIIRGGGLFAYTCIVFQPGRYSVADVSVAMFLFDLDAFGMYITPFLVLHAA